MTLDNRTWAAGGVGALSLFISNAPLCAPSTVQGDIFIIRADLAIFDATGAPVASTPGIGAYGVRAPAAADGSLRGSFALTSVDLFGDPNGCTSWDCHPIAQGLPATSGVFHTDAREVSLADPNAIDARISFSGLSFANDAYAGPSAGSLSASAPCALSLEPPARPEPAP